MQTEHIARAEALARTLVAATEYDVESLDAAHVHRVALVIADLLQNALSG